MVSATAPAAAPAVKHRNVNGFVHYSQCGVGSISRTSAAQTTPIPAPASKASNLESFTTLVIAVTACIALALAFVYAARQHLVSLETK